MTSPGAYQADRAAALSGVPKSTVHYWARQGILVPSVSADRVKLWSYADLVGLRIVYWLRHGRHTPEGYEIRAQSMPTVRQALASLRELDMELWSEDQGRAAVAVDRSGKLILDPKGLPGELGGQRVVGDVLDLMHPFLTEEGTKGPDLRTPRPQLRIVPGKLAGEPHVARSRVETQALASLSRRGMGTGKIARLYPSIDAAAISQAVDLERQLATNLSVAA